MTPIVDKLKKLIAMEKSSRSIGNQAEAEAFASKIASMLRDHKLSMSDVEFEAQAKTDPFGSEAFTQSGKTVWLWRIKLAKTIAQSLFCQSFYRSGENTIVFAGRETDRTHAIALYASLVDTAKRLVNVELRKAKKQGSLGISDIDWRKSFLSGFAAGIDSRLRAQHDLTAGSYTSLMVRDALMLRQFVDSNFRLSVGKPRKQAFHSDSFTLGKQHGNAVPMPGKKLALTDGR